MYPFCTQKQERRHNFSHVDHETQVLLTLLDKWACPLRDPGAIHELWARATLNPEVGPQTQTVRVCARVCVCVRVCKSITRRIPSCIAFFDSAIENLEKRVNMPTTPPISNTTLREGRIDREGMQCP